MVFQHHLFLFMNQVWQMLSRLENLLSPILGALYDMRLDVWIYYIRSVNKDRAESREDSGWSPHRGYMVVEDSFSKQGDIARIHNGCTEQLVVDTRFTNFFGMNTSSPVDSIFVRV
jgi:hypothetical protein